jgi:ribose transport system permease protein
MIMENMLLKFLKKAGYSVLLPVAIYLLLGILRPDVYFHFSTFVQLATQAMAAVLLGWSMLFGMSVGMFDFSVGSRLILGSLFGIHMSQIFGLPGFIIACILCNVVLAALTSLIYAILKIPSIITGFAALLIFESIGTIYQKTFSVVVTPNIKIFGTVPGIYVVVALTFIAVYIIFNHTRFGYQIKAIGGNEAIAKSMGIKAVRLKVSTYVVGGLILGIASIVRVGYMGTMNASTNMTSMAQAFTPMMGVMIGMFIASSNMVIGTYIGSLSITIVSSGLVALGIQSRLQNVVVGIFLLVFIGYKSNADALKKLFHIQGKSREVKLPL